MATAAARDHPAVAALVRELSVHPPFARLWAQRDVPVACSPLRSVRHPAAGELTFEGQLLDAGGGDLQLVVLEPGETSRERRLAHLGGAERRLRLLGKAAAWRPR